MAALRTFWAWLLRRSRKTSDWRVFEHHGDVYRVDGRAVSREEAIVIMEDALR